MKKILIFSVFLLAFMIASSDLFSYETRRGAQWVKTMNRNATTDAVDAAQNNPAGVVKMKDGLYFETGNQISIKKYTAKLKSPTPNRNIKASDNTPTILNPNNTLLYKKDKVALFVTQDVVDGGGTIEYNRLPAFTGSGSAHNGIGTSATMAFSVGGAFALNDMFSVAAGLRYFVGSYESVIYIANGRGKIFDAEFHQTGYQGFIGCNITPIKDLNIGINFQPKVQMRGKTKIHIDLTGGTAATALARIQLPTYLTYTTVSGTSTFGGIGKEEVAGLLATGIAYKPTEKMEVQASFTYEFEKQEKYIKNTWLGGSLAGYPAYSATALAQGIQRFKRRDGYNFGVGFEYLIGSIKPGIGVLYTKSPDTPASNRYQPNNPDLNRISVSAGLSSYFMEERLVLHASVLKAFFQNAHYFSILGLGKYNFKKDVMIIGLGLTYKIM